MVSKTTVIFAVLLATIYIVQCAPADGKKDDKKAVAPKLDVKEIKPDGKALRAEQTMKPKDVIQYATKTVQDSAKKAKEFFQGLISSFIS